MEIKALGLVAVAVAARAIVAGDVYSVPVVGDESVTVGGKLVTIDIGVDTVPAATTAVTTPALGITPAATLTVTGIDVAVAPDPAVMVTPGRSITNDSTVVSPVPLMVAFAV